jgi:ribosomal protein S27AE
MEWLINPPFELTKKNKKCPICGNKNIDLTDYLADHENNEKTIFNIYCDRCGCHYEQVYNGWQLKWMPDRKRGGFSYAGKYLDSEGSYIFYIKYFPKNIKSRARIRKKYNIKRKKNVGL